MSPSLKFFKSKSSDFLKLNCKIPQLYVVLINDFDKTFVLGFYNSFLKIKLSFDKENMLILNTYSLLKMFSNLASVLMYSLTKCVFEDGFKDSFVLKIF